MGQSIAVADATLNFPSLPFLSELKLQTVLHK